VIVIGYRRSTKPDPPKGEPLTAIGAHTVLNSKLLALYPKMHIYKGDEGSMAMKHQGTSHQEADS